MSDTCQTCGADDSHECWVGETMEEAYIICDVCERTFRPNPFA